MFNNTKTLVRLKKQSVDALSSFTKIVSDLTSNNKEIIAEKESREKQKLVLEEEIVELSAIEEANTKVITKIQNF